MKSKFAFACLMIASCISAVGAEDDRIVGMLRKADEILRQTTVVSNRAVGYSGDCPEANWALSIIFASNSDPIVHLLDLSEQCQPAGFVMCLLGVRALDENRFTSEFSRLRKSIEDANLKVETRVGCTFLKQPVLEVLEESGWSQDWLICDPIPELWETTRVEPIIDQFEETISEEVEMKANHKPDPTPDGVAHE